jgi:hypothetical protein
MRALANSAVMPTLKIAKENLELEYIDFEGTWEEFTDYVVAQGKPAKIKVLELWPEEFRQSASLRKKRIDTWQTNKLLGYLDKMDKLTDADKAVIVKDGDQSTVEMVPDNAIRLAALKFMISKIEGNNPELAAKPSKDAPQVVADEEFQEAMKNATGVRLSEQRSQRSIEFVSGTARDKGPTR